MLFVYSFRLSFTVFISGANAETKPFYNTYQSGLEDDNEEFAHLTKNILHLPGDDDEDVEMAAESEEKEPRQVVTTRELRRELQKASRENEVCLIYAYHGTPSSRSFAPARWVN